MTRRSAAGARPGRSAHHVNTRCPTSSGAIVFALRSEVMNCRSSRVRKIHHSHGNYLRHATTTRCEAGVTSIGEGFAGRDLAWSR